MTDDLIALGQCADALTRDVLLQAVAAVRTPAQRETVKHLARRGRPRSVFNDDPFSSAGYWAKQITFFLYHAEELDSPHNRERLRREFMLLREYEHCRCGRIFEAEPTPRSSSHTASSLTPVSPILLDLHRAYAAMPLRWEARTEVFLLLVCGFHPNTVADMRRNGKFARAHSRRIAAESVARTTMRGGLTGPVDHTAQPDGTMRWRGTIGSSFAAWLNQTDRQEIAA